MGRSAVCLPSVRALALLSWIRVRGGERLSVVFQCLPFTIWRDARMSIFPSQERAYV